MMDMQFVDEVKHFLRHKCQVLDKGYTKIKWPDFTLDLSEKYWPLSKLSSKAIASNSSEARSFLPHLRSVRLYAISLLF